jgi:hypothetical protein
MFVKYRRPFLAPEVRLHKKQVLLLAHGSSDDGPETGNDLHLPLPESSERHAEL